VSSGPHLAGVGRFRKENDMAPDRTQPREADPLEQYIALDRHARVELHRAQSAHFWEVAMRRVARRALFRKSAPLMERETAIRSKYR
jgi:hypothetical protein